eukprot:PhF_6_TR15072/c0_g1_i3/m.23694
MPLVSPRPIVYDRAIMALPAPKSPRSGNPSPTHKDSYNNKIVLPVICRPLQDVQPTSLHECKPANTADSSLMDSMSDTSSDNEVLSPRMNEEFLSAVMKSFDSLQKAYKEPEHHYADKGYQATVVLFPATPSHDDDPHSAPQPSILAVQPHPPTLVTSTVMGYFATLESCPVLQNFSSLLLPVVQPHPITPIKPFEATSATPTPSITHAQHSKPTPLETKLESTPLPTIQPTLATSSPSCLQYCSELAHISGYSTPALSHLAKLDKIVTLDVPVSTDDLDDKEVVNVATVDVESSGTLTKKTSVKVVSPPNKKSIIMNTEPIVSEIPEVAEAQVDNNDSPAMRRKLSLRTTQSTPHTPKQVVVPMESPKTPLEFARPPPLHVEKPTHTDERDATAADVKHVTISETQVPSETPQHQQPPVAETIQKGKCGAKCCTVQ